MWNLQRESHAIFLLKQSRFWEDYIIKFFPPTNVSNPGHKFNVDTVIEIYWETDCFKRKMAWLSICKFQIPQKKDYLKYYPFISRTINISISDFLKSILMRYCIDKNFLVCYGSDQ
jgi:hypothetical protein